MSERQGKPVMGTDATGADTYATVIASAAATERKYTHIGTYVASNEAIISVDGGVSDSFPVPTGGGNTLDDVEISGAICAKNLTAGSNYTNLRVWVW